jgi:hypothetical protein
VSHAGAGTNGEDDMNRRFALSFVVMFVMAMGLDFFVHGVLLYPDYEKLPNLMRPPAEAQSRMMAMVIAYICMAGAFTWIYLKGRENKPWLAQGLRYGTAIALLTAVPTYLIYYVVSPYPLDLVIKQIVLQAIVIELMAVVLAWLNRTD